MVRLAAAVAVVAAVALSAAPASAKRKRPEIYEKKAVFSPEECARIVEAARARPQEPAVLHNGKGGSRRDTLARDSTLTWLPVGGGAEEEWGWALERIEAQLGPGERAWGVKSTGLGTHGLQVAQYAPGHHYSWHTDASAPVDDRAAASGRVLSVTVQLSDPVTYTGGSVEMASYGNASTAQGTMVLFPSYLPHRVHPVDSGTRFSIVGWFAGKSVAEYWRLAANSYLAMLKTKPEVCDGHEWFAETLASAGRRVEAVDRLVDAVDCATGAATLLHPRVLENAASSPRLRPALAAAAARFAAATAAASGATAEEAARLAQNLQLVQATQAKLAPAVPPGGAAEGFFPREMEDQHALLDSMLDGLDELEDQESLLDSMMDEL